MTIPCPDQLLLREREIAYDTVFWAAGRRMSPRELLTFLGEPWTAPAEPTWHDLALILILLRRIAIAKQRKKGLAHVRLSRPLTPRRRRGDHPHKFHSAPKVLARFRPLDLEIRA